MKPFVASAPTLVDDVIHGVRVFEKLTRIGHPRRCSPFDASFVEVYRGVAGGKVLLLVCAAAGFRLPTELARAGKIAVDAERWRARGVAGVVDVGDNYALLDDVPGVRLRALVDATFAQGAALPVEVALDVAARTEPLLQAMRKRGCNASDTMVGWDGALTLLPCADACTEIEGQALAGDEVFDFLVVDTPGDLRDLFTGEEPRPMYGIVPEGHSAPLPPGLPSSVLASLASPSLSAAAAGRALADLGGVRPTLLGEIAQRLFPEVHARQTTVLEDLAAAGFGGDP